MNDYVVREVEIEKTVKDHFSVELDIEAMIVADVPVGPTSVASLFLTRKKQLYLFVDSKSPLTLGEVRKIVGRMGLKAETYLPPRDQPDYFDEIGRAKFQEVFPGKKVTNAQDIAYYRTLAPYRPALVLISEVTDGAVYQHDADAATGWRPSTKFTYRRIRTS